MVLIKQHDDLLYVASKDKLATLNVSTGSFEIYKPPPPLKQDKPSEIICLALSRKGNLKAISTINKQLFVYDVNMKLIRETILQRCASKIRFTKSDDLIIADKTGDAYIWNFHEANCEPSLILGHLSMLLDILLTDCGKFVVTSDRDEKIRVTNYPNTYNIQSFCLGHSEFVNSIEVIDEVLITSSGDGTIRFWDYKTGNLLNTIDTNKHLCNDLVENFCKTLSGDHMEIKAVPIVDMQIYKSDITLIAILLGGINIIQLYKISIVNHDIYMKYLDSIEDVNLLSFCLSSNLFVLSLNKLNSYEIIADKLSLITNDYLNNVFNNDFISKNDSSSENFTVLYKKKFDNVGEYLQRKKLRLENK